MKKKWFITIPFILAILFALYKIGEKMYWDYRYEHAIIKVELNSTTVPVYMEKMKISQFIREINGTLVTDPVLDTKELGIQKVTFEFINEENLKIPYTVEIEVIDNTPPFIFQGSSKTVTQGYDGNLERELFCGDNYDPNPKCTIEGEYDINTPGSYDLIFKGEDSSGNTSTHKFTLNVRKKTNSSSSSSGGSTRYTDFQKIRETYKGDNTKFGIDISHWQGDINFQKVKEAGVEFVYIRVGRGDGIGEDYVEDTKFEQNIKGFNEVGIPVGVYFYSNANGIKDAEKEAKWLMKKIKNYKVDLEIVFDWENWGEFQEYDLSFYGLKEMAKAFNKTVKKEGYTGMLYSSKSYLESVWYDIDFPKWLAHYTTQTNYSGNYIVWQLCDDGRVDGINGYVDLDIRYE